MGMHRNGKPNGIDASVVSWRALQAPSAGPYSEPVRFASTEVDGGVDGRVDGGGDGREEKRSLYLLVALWGAPIPEHYYKGARSGD